MSTLPLTVCKLGGSVLAGEAALPCAVHELYRHLRRGRRVVAIVSALEGATDALFQRGERVGSGASARHLAALVATGEAQAAALLGLALERAGVSAEVLDPRRAGLVARGTPLDAEPVALDRRAVLRALERSSVLVLPGYVGCDEAHAPALFGRGGSDLSALFVARELRAANCVLLKDVDGLFERDPQRHPGARRYATITWRDALRLGGEILQAKAARFAAEQRVAFEVRALAAADGTRVGTERTRFAAPRAPSRPLRVGLLGLGTVGGGVLRALQGEPERFELAGALARTERAELPPACFTPSFEALLARGCDALVECLGGVEPARTWIGAALARGVDVVSANKAVLAQHGLELERAARARGARMLFAAAAGGALPALERTRAFARRRGLRELRGVLNGTSSFVLDELAAGRALDAAIARAVQLGYAEADPTLDLDGTDVAHKLELLARAAGAEELVWRERRGIDALAPAAPGERTRLVATCALDGTRALLEVAPRALAPDDPLAATEGAGNALVLVAPDGARELWTGQGAGRWPTTGSVLADLGELARRHAALGARAEVA